MKFSYQSSFFLNSNLFNYSTLILYHFGGKPCNPREHSVFSRSQACALCQCRLTNLSASSQLSDGIYYFRGYYTTTEHTIPLNFLILNYNYFPEKMGQLKLIQGKFLTGLFNAMYDEPPAPKPKKNIKLLIYLTDKYFLFTFLFNLLIKIFVECTRKVWYSVFRKGKHPLQKWMPPLGLNVLTDIAPLLADRGAYFLYFLFLF